MRVESKVSTLEVVIFLGTGQVQARSTDSPNLGLIFPGKKGKLHVVMALSSNLPAVAQCCCTALLQRRFKAIYERSYR